MKRHHLKSSSGIGRFLRSEDGAILVEFGMSLPMVLIVFAVIVEGSRTMIAYQNAIGGVRDATRFLSRVAPSDICVTGASIGTYSARLHAIVTQTVSGNAVFTPSVTVNSVTPGLTCVAGGYRVDPAPVASVTANITISMPFSGVFALVGATPKPITTSITDRARVFGT